MPDYTAWGPLAHLIGTWEGDEGLDVAFAHATGSVGETPYRERTVMNPFGPVDNGTQALYGLDYRMSAWRGTETDPFHTEVGYWLWDAADRAVMRCFMIPRGCTVLAGGTATTDATSFTLAADVGSEEYGILSNPYLARAAHHALRVQRHDRRPRRMVVRRDLDHRPRTPRRHPRAHRPQPPPPGGRVDGYARRPASRGRSASCRDSAGRRSCGRHAAPRRTTAPCLPVPDRPRALRRSSRGARR